MNILDCKRVVIKIGSSLLCNGDTGLLHRQWLRGLCDDIATLRSHSIDVVVVSSGGVALGRHLLPPADDQETIERKQAASACGQIHLMTAYQNSLHDYGITVAQLLLTLRESEDRRSYLNARATLMELLDLGILPVINENDSITTQQVRVGDNDRLAARIALMADADMLFLLSDVDGLYTADPRKDPTASLLDYVPAITPDIMDMASGAGSDAGTGGMRTKLEAAHIATQGGCPMLIMNGQVQRPIQHFIDHKKGTLFGSEIEPRTARKQWIVGSLQHQGIIHIDEGALSALNDGNSLLAVGVTSVEDFFEKGDAVSIHGPDGNRVGCGLIGYDSDDAERISGKRADEITKILGHANRYAFIHRDDLVLYDLGEESE